MKTLSLCMIVKDEENFIEQCMNSVLSIVDEIIIVDTGSADKTVEIASKVKGVKIYNYKWNKDFGAARNQSLAYATSDWILVLDADEAIHPDDLKRLSEHIQTTDTDAFALKMCNFMDKNLGDNYTVHMGIRAFQNGFFQYKGAIHEQLIPITDNNPNIETTDIRILHYGYIKAGLDTKKRLRNMTLIKEQLDETPNDAFQLFNMGNEYMSQEDYSNALIFYNRANDNKDISMAYSPHLFYRRAVCMHELGQNLESLKFIDEGLIYYSKCTDMMYLKGCIYKKMGKYLLAMNCFLQCIELGAAPSNLSFFDGMHSFRPMIELAQLFDLQEDYKKAIEYYLKAMEADGEHYILIYHVGRVLNKMLDHKEFVSKNLENLFADITCISNRLVLIDVLITEGIYKEAAYYSKDLDNDAFNDDINYIKGKMAFYNKDYEQAFELLSGLIHDGAHHMLPQVQEVVLKLLLICCLKLPYKKERLLKLRSLESVEEANIVLKCFNREKNINIDSKVKILIKAMLIELKKSNESELFELCMKIIRDQNLISLIDIAEIYCRQGNIELTKKSILNYIKQGGEIDERTLGILNKVSYSV